jgi:hypothetical protein
MNALKQKNQKLVLKALKYNNLYDINNDLRDKASDEGEDKLYKKYDKLCQKYFDIFVETIDELPLYEVKRIEKFINN